MNPIFAVRGLGPVSDSHRIEWDTIDLPEAPIDGLVYVQLRIPDETHEVKESFRVWLTSPDGQRFALHALPAKQARVLFRGVLHFRMPVDQINEFNGDWLIELAGARGEVQTSSLRFVFADDAEQHLAEAETRGHVTRAAASQINGALRGQSAAARRTAVGNVRALGLDWLPKV